MKSSNGLKGISKQAALEIITAYLKCKSINKQFGFPPPDKDARKAHKWALEILHESK